MMTTPNALDDGINDVPLEDIKRDIEQSRKRAFQLQTLFAAGVLALVVALAYWATSSVSEKAQEVAKINEQVLSSKSELEAARSRLAEVEAELKRYRADL